MTASVPPLQLQYDLDISSSFSVSAKSSSTPSINQSDIATPLSPPLTPTDSTWPALQRTPSFEESSSVASSPNTLTSSTSDSEDDMNTSDDSNHPSSTQGPIAPPVRRISGSKPRRRHAKFSDIMESRAIAQTLSMQAKSRYRKSIPHSNSSDSWAPIEGTVQFNVFEQYKRDPKVLLTPAIVSVPVVRKTSPSHGNSDNHSNLSSEYWDHSYDCPPSPSSTYNPDSNLSIFELDDEQLGSHLWRDASSDRTLQPDMSVFDYRNPRITWKGSPLAISHLPYYDFLHANESLIASTLRLTPALYLKCRHTLLQAARDHSKRNIPFRKSDAQKLCRVDVNKTSRLWEIFGELGWLGEDWPGL